VSRTGLVLIALLVGALAHATPVTLPPGESSEDWAPAVGLARLELGEPAAGPWVRLEVGASEWTITARGRDGGVRRARIAPPTTPAAREAAIWLAVSLLEPTSGVELPGLPKLPELPPPPPRASPRRVAKPPPPAPQPDPPQRDPPQRDPPQPDPPQPDPALVIPAGLLVGPGDPVSIGETTTPKRAASDLRGGVAVTGGWRHWLGVRAGVRIDLGVGRGEWTLSGAGRVAGRRALTALGPARTFSEQGLELHATRAFWGERSWGGFGLAAGAGATRLAFLRDEQDLARVWSPVLVAGVSAGGPRAAVRPMLLARYETTRVALRVGELDAGWVPPFTVEAGLHIGWDLR